jgi:hypothetical protein
VNHERFKELGAAASIGQATHEELLVLERHAAQCDGCREAYFDYLNVASQEFAAAKQAPTLSAKDLEESINSELFTRRFFDRAKQEGIVFSREVDRSIKFPGPVPRPYARKPSRHNWQIATAAALFIAVVASGGYFYRNGSLRGTGNTSEQGRNPVAKTQSSAKTVDTRIQELVAANADFKFQISHLQAELRKVYDQLVATESDLRATSQDRQRLASGRDALQAKLDEAQRELDKSESMAVSAQQEAMAQGSNARDTEAKFVADEIKLHDLDEELKEKSALLDQERQLLSASHDVTDLMGARNLHIVDVVDTDPRGKSRPAFGRVFFTEGKSLIFYAYDLNEQKMQKANYQYQVWAKKEGPNQRALRLGIFYSDDKVQRRWMFRCDDPKILREIDSVFVTFERADGDPSHPEGSSLMYAYLRGQANHP